MVALESQHRGEELWEDKRRRGGLSWEHLLASYLTASTSSVKWDSNIDVMKLLGHLTKIESKVLSILVAE